MAPKKDYVIFVVNVALPNDEGINRDYLDNAKEIMVHMIEKMIYMKPTAEVGIILLGEEDDGDISVYQEVQVASFDLIRKINALNSRRGVFYDWLGGIRQAITFIDQSYRDLPDEPLGQVFLITNYEDHPSLKFKSFAEVVTMSNECKLNVRCIGSKDLKSMSDAELNRNEKKFLEFCSQVEEATYFTFDFQLPGMRFFQSNPKKFCPWKCDLELFNIKIPTLTANKVNRLPAGKPWTTVAVENAKGEKIEPVQLDKQRQLLDSENKVHDPEDTIKGYPYGRKFIPVTEYDEHGMKLAPEFKSFKLYGVADASTVGFKYRTEMHTWQILPQEGCEERFFYLLMAMKNLNLVGFVRRVYNDGNTPTMNILVPCTDHPELPWCFLMYQLIYGEEEGIIEAEPLEDELDELSEEQKTAVGDIIDSMFIDGDGQDTAFKFIPAPDQQHIRNIMSFRALYPDEPLPAPKDYIKAAFEPPAKVDLEKLKVQVERVRELFDLEEEEDDDVRVLYEVPGTTKMEVDDNAPRKSSQKPSQGEKRSQKN